MQTFKHLLNQTQLFKELAVAVLCVCGNILHFFICNVMLQIKGSSEKSSCSLVWTGHYETRVKKAKGNFRFFFLQPWLFVFYNLCSKETVNIENAIIEGALNATNIYKKKDDEWDKRIKQISYFIFYFFWKKAHLKRQMNFPTWRADY